MTKPMNEEHRAAGSMAVTVNARRHRYILSQISGGNAVLVKDIAEALSVSETTVRRDLQLLEENGQLVRIHGGAAPLSRSTILPLAERKGFMHEEKGRIAQKAASLIQGMDTVFVGGGTSTLALAQRIVSTPPLLCVTNMVDVALLLATAGQSDVVLLGGHVDAELRVLRGLALSEQLSRYRFDAVVTSTNAVSSADGFLDHDEQSAHNRRQLCTLTECHIVLADHTKFGRKSRFRTMPFDAVTDLVTDRRPDQEYLDALNKAGVRLHIAD